MKKFKNINFNKLGRRQLILAGLIVMIAVAGYVNLNYQTDEAIPASKPIENIEVQKPSNDYFTNSRLEKEKSRSAAMDVYREIIENQKISQEEKQKAQKDLAASAKAIENEPVVEGLIKAKGFEEAIVYIAEGGVNVVVKTNGLTPAQAAQIKDIVVQTTKISSDKIKIVEIK